jgi:ATP-binding cassette, subfamily B, bacterial MsbA
MKIYIRLFHYLRPSKGRLMLVVMLSMMTSLLGIVSIYSIIPLLNNVFNVDDAIEAPAHPVTQDFKKTSLAISITSDPVVFQGINTEKLRVSVTESFSKVFYSETKERTLLNICLFLIASFALKNLFIFLNSQLLFRIKTNSTKSLRDDVFRNIIDMHLDFFHKNRVGDLMTLVYNDVQAVNDTVSLIFINFLQNPFSIIVYVAALLIISWKLTLFASITSLCIFFIIRVIGIKVNDLAVVFRIKMGDMHSVLQEKFSGIKVIKSNAFENVELDRFQAFTKHFSKLDIKIGMLRNIIGPMNETMFVTAIATVLWFGGLEVFHGYITSSELMLFIFTLYSTMGPIKELGDVNTLMAVGKASAERLFELLDTVPDISNGTRSISSFTHVIRFEDVSFKYSNETGAPNILDHVSFEIRKGEIVALVGQSGSGKSTMVDLLLRFYDVDAGRITIDGVDVREYDFKQIRRMIGLVSQEVILFNDTIGENIAYGSNGKISREKIIAAAKMANAHPFIDEKPKKYETLIGDRGVQLSGGQRQRLAIARAMVKNPKFLIFDEATSALDNESEKVVQAAIDHALTNYTALVVAHRLSTIRNADRIIVMDRGRVIETGNHQELLRLDGLYKHLYDIQFSGKIEENDKSYNKLLAV